MCGIVGYIGDRQAAPVLLQGLERLEYRGYDSAGIAVVSQEDSHKIEVVKSKGRLEILEQMTDNGNAVHGCCGIAHTRWATHGEPNTVNAHPHVSRDSRVVVVHNGIIENYQQLKEKLMKKGYEFVSNTDTEVVAQLLDYYYTGSPLEAIQKVLYHIHGSYALEILFQDRPEEFYAVRKESPMIIGLAEGEYFCASDVPAILKYTREVVFIDNHEIAKVTKNGVTYYNADGEEVQKEAKHIEWDASAAEKCGYEHFMLKEIHEQPAAVRDTICSRIKDGVIDLSDTGLTDEIMRGIRRIYMVACGSAYHTAVVGKYVFEDLARVPVEVDIASEFRYRNPIIEPDSMLVVISQSGETADSLAALKGAKASGAKILAIVNVVGSSIAREADNVIYTHAGPEISVATTKAYSAQLAVLYMLAAAFAKAKAQIDSEKYAALIQEMLALPDKIEAILADKERIQWFANKFAASRDIFFIGRSLDYGVSLEGSLKLKELSYIHSEAYAAGELKHGPISLIEDGTLVVAVLTQAELYEKVISNMVEVQSRGAYLFGLTSYGNYNIEEVADFTVYVPKTDAYFMASLAVVPLQLFAYYVAVAKGLDVDKPRNLAKSVTVE